MGYTMMIVFFGYALAFWFGMTLRFLELRRNFLGMFPAIFIARGNRESTGSIGKNSWKSMKIHENPWKSHSYIVRHHFPHEDSSIGLPVVFLSDSKATTARSTPPPERNGSQETSWPSSSASLLAASWRLERNWESCVCLASHTLVVC